MSTSPDLRTPKAATTSEAHAQSLLEGLFSRSGKRFMKMAEELLGDEIDARLARIPQHLKNLLCGNCPP